MGLNCPIATFLSSENLKENLKEMEADKKMKRGVKVTEDEPEIEKT